MKKITRIYAPFLTAGLLAAPTLGHAEDTLTIGVIELFGGPFFAEARRGIADAVGDREIEILIENAEGDVAKEADLVQTFITRQVDAIMISAQSPVGSIAAMRLAREAGIPVVCYDTCLAPPEDQELSLAFVTSDNRGLGVTTGEQAANYIRDELGGTAQMIMLTCETFDVCKARREGIDEALEGLDVTLLDEQEAFQLDTARPIADAMLAANPDVTVFIAQNDGAAIAAGQAVEDARLVDQVKVFAIDINPQVARRIADPEGAIEWATGQDPYAMGYDGILNAIMAARGEPIETYYQFTPSPTFSSADPASAEEYFRSR